MLDDAPYVERNQRTELVTRLLAQACELCGSALDIEVHHVRRLVDLHRVGRGNRPPWVKRMAAMQAQNERCCHAGQSSGDRPKPRHRIRAPGGEDRWPFGERCSGSSAADLAAVGDLRAMSAGAGPHNGARRHRLLLVSATGLPQPLLGCLGEV
jgi:hypothetical protein